MDDGVRAQTGKDREMRSRWILIAIVLGSLALSLFVIIGNREADIPPVRTGEQEERMDTLYHTGILERFDAQSGTAYVDPALWHACNVDIKTGLLATLSKERECAGQGRSVDVFDYQSGRKVASYGAGGVKFY